MNNCDECRNYGDEDDQCLDCVQPMFVTDDGIC